MSGTIWSMAAPEAKTASFSASGASPAGKAYTLSAAAGLTVTLPAATGSGDRYRFHVITTVTSNDYIIQVTTTDVISGGLAIATDIAGVVLNTAATTDTITMNGSTTGGVLGSWVELVDISDGVWSLEGFLISTGDEATPFSAAVS